jgi:hypothetical protein
MEVDDKIKYGFNGSNFELAYDGNADGENSVKMAVNLMEVLDELKKGDSDSVEIEAKSVKISMEGSKIIIKVDANKDGEEFLLVEADLAEGFDEAF